MRKAKIKVLGLGIVLLLFIVGMNGCKKCYECSVLRSTFYCYKNGDTIGFDALTGRSATDSLNYYRSNGYTWDTIQFTYSTFGFYNNPTCGQENYNHAVIDNQDKCVQTK